MTEPPQTPPDGGTGPPEEIPEPTPEQNMIEEIARRAAEIASEIALAAISEDGLKMLRGTVMAVDSKNWCQIRRVSSVTDEGTPGDPDAAYYPVVSPGYKPKVGQEVFGYEVKNGPIIVGALVDTGYRDIADVDTALIPIGGWCGWGGLSDPPGGKYLICDGRLLSRASYPALSAVLGTTWHTGGEASTQVRLPDFRSRAPVGAGQGGGLSTYSPGQRIGQEGVELTTTTMPSHTHSGSTSSDSHAHSVSITSSSHFHTGDTYATTEQRYVDGGLRDNYNVTWHLVGQSGSTDSSSHNHGSSCSSDSHSHSLSINSAGSGAAHENRQPSLATHFIMRVLP